VKWPENSDHVNVVYIRSRAVTMLFRLELVVEVIVARFKDIARQSCSLLCTIRVGKIVSFLSILVSTMSVVPPDHPLIEAHRQSDVACRGGSQSTPPAFATALFQDRLGL
jgi:hypothetical protein